MRTTPPTTTDQANESDRAEILIELLKAVRRSQWGAALTFAKWLASIDAKRQAVRP